MRKHVLRLHRSGLLVSARQLNTKQQGGRRSAPSSRSVARHREQEHAAPNTTVRGCLQVLGHRLPTAAMEGSTVLIETHKRKCFPAVRGSSSRAGKIRTGPDWPGQVRTAPDRFELFARLRRDLRGNPEGRGMLWSAAEGREFAERRRAPRQAHARRSPRPCEVACQRAPVTNAKK